MIPLRIETRNLGAIPHAEIDLSGITLAAIAGPNGAGKSTLFTLAPTFALFGISKNGCSVDHMVRRGTTEMTVTFDFEHRGETYRVIRTRSTKGRGKSTLELQRLDKDEDRGLLRWVSESGTTIRETEEKIRALLNLDPETFTASSMILQGRHNEFTAKPPGQRKAVLAQILGLEVYDQLLEKAREKERAANLALEKTKAKVAELKEKLQAKEGLENDLAGIKAELEELAGHIEAREAELRKAEDLIRQLTIKAERAKDLEKQIIALADEINEKRKEILKLQEQVDRAKKVLDAEPQILAKTAEFEQVKQQVAVLQTKKPRLAELLAEERKIVAEVAKLEGQIAKIAPQIKSLEDLLKNAAVFQQAASEYEELLAMLEHYDRLADEWNDLSAAALNAEREAASWDRTIEANLAGMEEILVEKRRQAELLDQVSCQGTEMAKTCPLLASARDAQREIDTIQEKMERLHKAVNPHISKWQDLLKRRDSLQYNLQEHKRLKEQAARLRPKAEQASKMEANAKLLETLREQKKQAEELKAEYSGRLEILQPEIQSLSQEISTLADLEGRLPNLERWAQAKEQLPAARQVVTTAQERIEAINQEIAAKEVQASQLEKERTELSISVTRDLPLAQAAVREIKENIGLLRDRQNTLHAQAGKLQAHLEDLSRSEDECRRLTTEIEPLAKELARWQTLIKAFGKDGIPALIIENAIPELESISNEILSQMTRGKHSVRFETQRDAKSRAGQIETLDIIISDWTGDGPYETFSGGEQLRIDFAIRFALAELLARRAGSRVEWLTIDEGLGSQDAEHRALVLEAIKAVADRFKKVFVITHIEEAKSFFDQVIYVEPNGAGTEVKVS